jgi:hypothetical protein
LTCIYAIPWQALQVLLLVVSYVEVAIVDCPLRHRILSLLFIEITWMVSFLVYIYGRDERTKNGEIFLILVGDENKREEMENIRVNNKIPLVIASISYPLNVI